jgi:putrescine---pyruvate transaminase
VVASNRVRELLWSPEAGALRHGYTYSGHPAACAVALANLDILESERLVDRVAALEPVLARELGALASHPLVGEVRTAGLLCGVELSSEARRIDSSVVDRVVAEALERGVLMRNLVGAAVQISPPFVIDEQQLALVAATLTESLDAVAATV